MRTRYAKALLPLAAVAAISVPAVAQASHGSDDPPQHVRQEDRRGEHQRVEHRRVERHSRADDGPRHDRRGSDDGPNDR